MTYWLVIIDQSLMIKNSKKIYLYFMKYTKKIESKYNDIVIFLDQANLDWNMEFTAQEMKNSVSKCSSCGCIWRQPGEAPHWGWTTNLKHQALTRWLVWHNQKWIVMVKDDKSFHEVRDWLLSVFLRINCLNTHLV